MAQFRTRDVLLFTLIVALSVGWVVDHRREVSARKAAEARAATAVQQAQQSGLRSFALQSELNEHILQYGPLLKIAPLPSPDQTLELRGAEPPARDPDI